MRRYIATALLAALATGCASAEIRDQWLVRVHTDMLVPRLADRLLVEVLADDGASLCAECTRVFGVVDQASFPLSFGIPRSTERVRLRLRLHRANALDERGLPRQESTIDRVVVLEGTTGKQTLDVNLLTTCIGFATDLGAHTTCNDSAQLAPETALSSGEVPIANGSWSGGNTVGCSGPDVADMPCIPGGAFFLGEPSAGLPPQIAAAPEHLMLVSPFRLDAYEFTVGQARSLLPSLPSATVEAASPEHADCTFRGIADPSADPLPLNCVSRATAAALCAAVGKRLPTQTEWEYAAANTVAETPFPWGREPATCGRSQVGRGANFPLEPGLEGDTSCRFSGNTVEPRGPRAAHVPCSSDDDCTEQGIRDLGGNLAEWVSDAFSLYNANCWKTPGILVNHVCEAGTGLTARGAHWTSVPASARSTKRVEVSGDGTNMAIGFRCAHDAT